MANALEQLECDLSQVIEDAHRQGLTYWTILKILTIFVIPKTMQRSEAEYYLKGGK